MAGWHRKRGTLVYVSVYKDGKKSNLPRLLTKHLDNESDSNIDYWVAKYEQEHGLVKRITSDYNLTQRVEDYCNYLTSRNKTSGTVAEHRRHLLNHVIPYFLELEPPQKNPNLWGTTSIKMLASLNKKGLTQSQIFRCNVALRCFYKWLSEENHILGNGEIHLRNPLKEVKTTQLKETITPQEIITKINATTDIDLKLTLILGYFFSLRPQEIFGVRVGDFRAGKSAESLECCKAMKSINLYDRVAVNIQRQLTKQLIERLPKSDSNGWVACFNKETAILFIKLLTGRAAKERVLNKNPNLIYKAWDFEFAVKDLRRASLYWLGHNTEISQNQLMKHARHKSYETTLIYLRRPDEDLGWEGLDVADL